MVLGSLCLFLFSQTTVQYSKADVEAALALWREYGKPVETKRKEFVGTTRSGVNFGGGHFTESEILSEALPLADGGKFDEAIKVLQSGDPDYFDRWLGAPVDKTIASRTAMHIYTHLVNDFLDLTPAEQILNQLEKLNKLKLIGESKFRSSRGIDDFISQLRQTVQFTPARPNSVQAAVNDLVFIRIKLGVIGAPRNLDDVKVLPVECERILSFGIDAVEPLMFRIESEKLTRSFFIGFNNSPSCVVGVDYFARYLILKIAKGDLGSDHPWDLTGPLIQEWLAAKRKGKVEEWLMGNLILPRQNGGYYCNYRSFEAVSVNYPHLLKKAVKVAREADIDSVWIMQAMERAKLSSQEKKALIEGKIAE